MNRFIFIALLFIFLCAPHPGRADALRAESFAKNVHLSYLDGNFSQMTLFIKQALEAFPYDESLKRNLLGVLEKAYTLPGAKTIAPDWHLPKEIKSIDVGLYRHTFENDLYWGYDVAIAMHVAEGSIADLKLTNIFGEVILQKKTAVGKWTEGNKSHGEWSVKLQEHLGKDPLVSGLYYFDVVFTDQKVKPFHGWFLVPEDVFNSFPTVTSPKIDELFLNPSPVFSWDKFGQPLTASYSRIYLSSHINSQDCEKAGSVFYLTTTNPLQQFQLGALPSALKIYDNQAVNMTHKDFENFFNTANTAFVKGIKKLKNGKHLFTIEYDVDRQFGDLGFALVTQNTIGFRVDTGEPDNNYNCEAIQNEYAKP